MARALRELEVPDHDEAEQAAAALDELAGFLRNHPTPTARMVLVSDADGETPITVPSAALRLFTDILAQLANGNAVTIAPVHAELTTQQSAEFLGVSRPYLITLLDEQKIPFRRVGNRRKVLLNDLLSYRRLDEQHRTEVRAALTREAEELGLEY